MLAESSMKAVDLHVTYPFPIISDFETKQTRWVVYCLLFRLLKCSKGINDATCHVVFVAASGE
jgi:hypothetical protein